HPTARNAQLCAALDYGRLHAARNCTPTARGAQLCAALKLHAALNDSRLDAAPDCAPRATVRSAQTARGAQ
ncbi:hypothetical protein, partial [Dactylosporangium sp. NPDC049140]|uniref:hypothetical protein n=1 Tax=Dactylosporangium sp. NPDC049140 TaxID=3155647 RepID=UPI0033ECA010